MGREESMLGKMTNLHNRINYLSRLELLVNYKKTFTQMNTRCT
jgi:hypothetical protein